MEFNLIRCKSLVVYCTVRLMVLCYFCCILMISPLSSNLFCIIFADDTALLISDTDPTNLEKKS